MPMSSKPDNIQLVTQDFNTPAQRAAARDIILCWPSIKNFAEISKRTGWSEPHLRAVFDEYFEGAESASEASRPEEADIIDKLPETGYTDSESYREGFRDGYRDGFAHGQES